MTDFLLELRSEEVPARMQARARDDLAKLFAAELTAAGVAPGAIVTYATPRRLVLIARDLPGETSAVSEEIKGPKASAPPQALEGFLRKTGLRHDQLVERDGVLFAVIERPGLAMADVLAAAVPAIVRGFAWPKSMRWGDASISTESQRWVRPLQGIVALFGGDVVACEVAGIASGRETVGHRFHSSGPVSISSAATYADQLRAGHVIVDQDERAQIIALGATMAARKAGLELVQDEGLLAENAGLTEWPVPLLGRFDEAFLDVPPEVIQLTARVNQKYFVCRSPLPPAGGAGGGPFSSDAAPEATPTPDPSREREGGLANAFICTANIDAADGGARIIEGNRKVLAARLSDAKFFYDTDLKVPLEEQAKKLDRIVFHEKLRTVADKVERVAKLARWLVEEGIILPGTGRGTSEAGGGGAPRSAAPEAAPLHHLPEEANGPPPRAGEDLATLAERAALLCKADLVTGMVGEFPELQGLMGGYYAAAQGEDPRVAAAIRDHYKPVGQGDDVPTDPVTVAVSLADKLDTLCAFFAINEKPTGSRDPFALRRAAIAVGSLVLANGLRINMKSALFEISIEPYRIANPSIAQQLVRASSEFIDVVGNKAAGAAIIAALENQPVSGEQEGFELGRQIHSGAVILLEFLIDRLKVQQREAGVRHDLIDAVFALGGEDDLVRLLARVHALQSFIATADGTNLLSGYKRAANILKKEGFDTPLPGREGLGVGRPEAAAALAPHLPTPDPSLSGRGAAMNPAEGALVAALDAAEPRAAAAIEAEDFEDAMTALAALRAPIDAFFDAVMINDPDPDTRAFRLGLLARFRDAVHRVADFSRIEG